MSFARARRGCGVSARGTGGCGSCFPACQAPFQAPGRGREWAGSLGSFALAVFIACKLLFSAGSLQGRACDCFFAVRARVPGSFLVGGGWDGFDRMLCFRLLAAAALHLRRTRSTFC